MLFTKDNVVEFPAGFQVKIISTPPNSKVISPCSLLGSGPVQPEAWTPAPRSNFRVKPNSSKVVRNTGVGVGEGVGAGVGVGVGVGVDVGGGVGVGAGVRVGVGTEVVVGACVAAGACVDVGCGTTVDAAVGTGA